MKIGTALNPAGPAGFGALGGLGRSWRMAPGVCLSAATCHHGCRYFVRYTCKGSGRAERPPEARSAWHNDPWEKAAEGLLRRTICKCLGLSWRLQQALFGPSASQVHARKASAARFPCRPTSEQGSCHTQVRHGIYWATCGHRP